MIEAGCFPIKLQNIKELHEYPIYLRFVKYHDGVAATSAIEDDEMLDDDEF